MSKIKKILLAFDFNTTTNSATNKAAYLAQLFDAELILVHAVEYIPYHSGLNYWNIIHDEVKPKIEEVCNSLSEKGIKVRTPVIKEGRPYNVVLAASSQFDVDMIVIGAGKLGVADSLLGTTTVKIIRNASQPVFVVYSQKSGLEIKNILCAVDLSIASSQVLIAAKNLSKASGARLSILHVVPKSKKYPGLDKFETPVVDVGLNANINTLSESNAETVDEVLQASSAKMFDDYVKKAMGTYNNYEQILRQGVPNVEISNEVNSKDYDLLIMGTIDQSGFSRILVGNITEKVMRKTSCSLLTLKFQNIPPLLSTQDSSLSEVSKENDAEKALDFIEAHYRKGKKLLAEKRANEAIQEFRVCLEKDRHFYGAYEALGDCYLLLEDLEKSKLYFEKARNQRRYIWDLRKT